VGTLPDQCPDECLYGRASDLVIGLVMLRLQIDAIQAKSVLIDDSVDPTVTGLA
jgi:hypothetical protein